jgi:hypothetical protein
MVRPAPSQAASPPAAAAPVSAPPQVQAAPTIPPPPVATPQPVAATPSPAPAAAVTPVAVTPASGAEADSPCPTCGRVNTAGRRFCAHCGQQLLSAAVAGAPPPAPAPARGFRAWWARKFDSRDRAARRAYRQSLPALYRWRRVLIGLGLVVGLVAGLAVAGRNPVGFVVARYHDVRGTTVAVPVTGTVVEPADATVPKSDPAALTDRTEAAWTMRWQPTAEGNSCGGAAGTGVVVLSIAPTRIRAINVQAGLLANNGRRPLQARPLALGVMLDGGPCQRLVLADTAEEQVLKLDSKVLVREVRIGVDAAAPPREDGEPVLSFTEITIRARPQ